MALTQITEKGIKDGEIINADINASAAIAKSKLASLDIVNADINASAAIAGSKIAPAFTSNISITNANPNITFLDSDANSDFKIDVNGGLFSIKDHTNADASRMSIASDGKLSIDRTHASATTGNHPALDIDTHANGTAGATFATGIDFRIAGVHKKRLAITNADSSAGTGDWVFYRDNGGNECMRLTSDGNIAFNRPNATVGDNQSGNSTATPKRFVFNNDHSNGYTDGSLKLYLFNGGTTRHGFTSGPNYDLQYHSSGSATEAKHTFFTQNTERLRLDALGRLLIGTTAAGEGSADNLTVADSSHCGITIRSGSSSGGNVFFTDLTSGDQFQGYVQYNHSDDTLKFGTNKVERLRLSSKGAINSLFNDGDSVGVLHKRHQGSNSHNFFEIRSSGTTTTSGGTLQFAIETDGDVKNTNNSYGSLSDIKLKENIVDAKSQWDDIKALKIRNYNFKSELDLGTYTQIGLIAQEVEETSSGLVVDNIDRDDEGNDLGTITKTLRYSVLHIKALKALQEAITKIETLETKVAALEAA